MRCCMFTFGSIWADPAVLLWLGVSSEGLGERGAQWTEVVSWEPRAFVYHNFLVINPLVRNHSRCCTAMIHSFLLLHSALHQDWKDFHPEMMCCST